MTNRQIAMIVMLVEIVAVFAALQIAVMAMIYVERRLSAFIQDRWGPNRVGPQGILQPMADGIKLLFKEDIIPKKVDRLIYILAPVSSAIPALMLVAVIPFAGPAKVGGYLVRFQIADVNVGILYILAIGSLSVYGVIFGAWASNNKYSLLGGVRSAAQMLSYELFMGASLVGVLMLAGSLRMSDIVLSQSGRFLGVLPAWNLFRQPLAFGIFMVAALAENHRMPFDLPESEQELVGGFHTEYSSIKFALYFMSEYASVLIVSALIVTLFCGGYLVPGLWRLGLPPIWSSVIEFVAFSIKTGFFVLVIMWIRWTLSRFRQDQMMYLGWKVMLPLALVNIILTGAVMAISR